MKPFSLRGLAVFTALLLVPLLAAPVLAQQNTWYFNPGGAELSKPFDIPCQIVNIQAGEPAPTDLLVMALRVVNSSSPAAEDWIEYIRVTSDNSMPGMLDNIYLYRENGGATPTDPTDFDPAIDDLVGTINLLASGSGSGTHTGADDAAVLTDAAASWAVDELVGMTIENTTDGSSATITANTATTVTGVLGGGTEDDWDLDDDYVIPDMEFGNNGVAIFDLTALPGGGYSLPADGEENFYIVVDVDPSIVGDANYAGAELAVQIDGDEPGMELTNAGVGPLDVDGPGGNPEVIDNDPNPVAVMETRTPDWFFETTNPLSDMRLGTFNITYSDVGLQKVVSGSSPPGQVVMGLIIDNSRSTVDDQLDAIVLRSRCTQEMSISRIAVYKEATCIVPTNYNTYTATGTLADILWAQNATPGAFGWGADPAAGGALTLPIQPAVGAIAAGEIIYLYVVVDLNETAINADEQSRDDYNYGEVGVALNSQLVSATDPEAFTFQEAGIGPRVAADGDRIVVYNPLAWEGAHDGSDDAATLEDSGMDWIVNELVGFTVLNLTDGSSGTISANTATTVTATLAGGTEDDWDIDDEYYIPQPPGQPLIIDSKPPVITCIDDPFNMTTFPYWEHTDDGGDVADYGVGVIDNNDQIIARFQIEDEGPGTLVTSGPNRPKVDLRVFGTNPSGGYTLMTPEPDPWGLIWRGEVIPIPDSDNISTQRTDTLSGNKKLEVVARDNAGNIAEFDCPVLRDIDTRRPSFAGVPMTFAFAPGGDANGDDIAAIGDVLRITADMGQNWMNWNRQDGQGLEIKSLTADLSLWGMPGIGIVELVDPSGDNQSFSVDFVVTGDGNFNNVLSSEAVTQIALTAVDNADNMRISSDFAFAGTGIDNVGPGAASGTWTLYSETPTNNVINIGDAVRFTIDMSGVDDVADIYTDLFVAGLGGNHVHNFVQQGTTDIWILDHTVLDPRDNLSVDYAKDEANVADACPVVPVNNGARYDIDITITDLRGNVGMLTLGPPVYPHLLGVPGEPVAVDTKVPEPVTNLTGMPLPDGAVLLEWDNPTDGAGVDDTKDGPLTFEIYWDEGAGADPATLLATVTEATPGSPCATIDSWRSDTTVAMQANFVCGETYRFKIKVYDNANNESDWSTTVAATTDCDAPAMCVFQPATRDTFSCDICDWNGPESQQGLTIYIQPVDEASQDVTGIGAVWARLKWRGGMAGPWTPVGYTDAGASAPYTYALLLDCADLDAIVGANLTDSLELVILANDEAGNTPTAAEAAAACGYFEFWWSTSGAEGQIGKINDELPEYQAYCEVHGWEIAGATNTVEITLTAGVPPYKARAFADDDEDTGSDDLIWYAEDLTDLTTTFNLDVTGWSKGEGTLTVEWCDATGAFASAEVKLCVLDEIAPCARVVNPMDGKCIRRAHSVLDPVPVTVEIDPLANCLDPNGVVKVDYEWAQECCIGTYSDTQTVRDSVEIECNGGEEATCDTFWNETLPTFIDSINCTDPGQVCWQIFFRLDTLEISCDTADWNNFAIQPGDSVDAGLVTAWWFNKDDLAWVTASGTTIYIRARVYDDQGNIFITDCVQVCVDIDTPPLCLYSPDECIALDGIPRLSGSSITMIAELNWAEGNVDDIEDIFLYRKKSTDADRWENWTSLGAGVPATSSSMWRWDNVDVTGLTDQVYYDYRVIAKTIWGSWSYDVNGDGQFDHNTFDALNCDAVTWLIDHSAENIWIDTVWTMIGEEELIQPNTSCTLSDPRGWAWTQYGNDITVQPLVEPLGLTDDIVKVTWTLYSDDGTCSCVDPFVAGDSSKVVAINQGANALDAVTFNPAEMAFWLYVEDGYQTVILQVEAEDACGNTSSDCIELYLLDIKPTEAIIILPKDGAVFCQNHETEGGGITITAQTLLDEYFTKAVFGYSTDGENWIRFDSTTSASTNGNLSGTWNPHALGLADGVYQLAVWAEDNAGNRQGNIYPNTVYLSCGVPTVTMTYPTADMFIGCPTELIASATAPDDYNYITKVEFFYQATTSSTANPIGSDLYSVDGFYSVAWDPALNGDYYLWAQVTVKSGETANSEMVKVSADATKPEVNVLQVDGDMSDGGLTDPTLITAGDEVTIYAEAWDRLQPDGSLERDNCGLDKVMIYAQSGDTEVFGVQMTFVESNTFTAVWPTTGLAAGNYKVYAVATDACCNSQTSAIWNVTIVNPIPEVVIGVDEAEVVCGMMATNADEITIIATADPEATISKVEFFASSTAKSDVYDQYTSLETAETATGGVFTITVDVSAWEGVYRLRAIAGGGSFNDFTFDEANAWDMLLGIDRSAPTPSFTLAASVIQEGTEFEITVADPPCGDCDIDHYEYGIVTAAGVYGTRAEYITSLCEFSFDPVDSGAVTMVNCYWGGYVRVTAVDPLGNETYAQLPVEILSVEDGDALVTTPAHGTYVAGTVAIAATAVGTVTEYTFKYTLADGTGGDVIGTSTDGTILWDTETDEVPDGTYLLWVKGSGDYHALACAVPVVLVNDCATVVLHDPMPNGTCHDGHVMFIGGTVDLLADVTLTSDVAIDSVVFKYKTLDAPGGHTASGDPALGWVLIATDRYKATSWDVPWALEGVPDGYYVIMAFSYDRSGQECHSNSITVFVDNTSPYSEISEVNGDQTVATCADVTEGDNVEIVAVAVDDRSPLGPGDAYNSCPRYLQFFAGQCGEGAIGAVDIVWVVDASGSMSDEQAVIGSQIDLFINALGGADYQLGVVAFESEGFFNATGNDTTKSMPMAADGSYDTPLEGTGVWTTNQVQFNTMVTSVGISGGVEDGAGSLMETLEHYTFRQNSRKYFILVTDESGDDNELESEAIALLKQNNVTVHCVTGPSFTTYSNIAAETNGQVYDIGSADWGALLAVLGTQISGAGVAGPTPFDPIWGQAVDLDTDAPSVHWNTTGLAPGEYCLWTVITDNVGNQYTSEIIKVCVYDKTPPVAWIAGFGDATLACPSCASHRIYAMSCDTDVRSIKFEMRPAGSVSELDWATIGISAMIDSSLWYTDWNPCGSEGDYDLRAVPASNHYEVGTTEHVTWDIDPDVQPVLAVTFGATDCSLTYPAGDISTVTFEDKSSGNLGLVRVDAVSAPNYMGLLGIYQPLNDVTLTTEKVDLVQMLGMTQVAYLGNFDDNDILLGGVGSFYASYYDAENLVSYLAMSDVSVARVYPTLGMPGILYNMATDAYLSIDRDAVTATNGVIILPSRVPTMFTGQNDLYNVWDVSGYLPAIRFTNPTEGGLADGKYAKIQIPYGSGAPIVDSLAVAWWDGDEWKVNQGIFFGQGADGFDADSNTVEFYAADLHGIYAVVSNDAEPCEGPITVTAAPHDAISPWASDYTDHDPTFNTLVRSNITGNDNNWDVDSLQTHVKLDGVTIYNNGANATGWITTWDNVSGLLQTRWNGAPGLEEGTHTYWVKARTFQGCAKELTVTFDVDETAPLVDWTHDYVCPNPEFKIVVTDNGGAGVDLDNIQADVYDYDLSLGTEIPSDKLVYEEHASGFELRSDTLVFSMTAHNANYRRYVVVLWDGMSGGRTSGEDDDDRDFSDNKWVYHNDHGVPDMVGNHATPVFRMFTVGGEGCGDQVGEEPYNDPNPFDPWAGEITDIYVGASGGVVSVKIYDLAGEKVITLAESEPVINTGQSVQWDGKVNGQIVASGVYLCHISGENNGRSFSHVVKIAVVKTD